MSATDPIAAREFARALRALCDFDFPLAQSPGWARDRSLFLRCARVLEKGHPMEIDEAIEVILAELQYWGPDIPNIIRIPLEKAIERVGYEVPWDCDDDSAACGNG